MTGCIAVTGGSGFLGSYLLPKLPGPEFDSVVALTRRLPAETEDQVASTRWVQGDLGSMDDCRRLIEPASVVIHLAHATTPITSDRNWPAEVQLNLVPTLNLLQAIRESGERRHVIYASSGGAVYQPPHTRLPVKETAPCFPVSSYGIVKLAVEHYLRVAAAQGWLTATALRIGNPYGVLLPVERMQGFIGVALNRVIHSQPVRVFGDPNNVRDYVHLEDVRRMFKLVLTAGHRFKVFNVGSGVGQSVRDILTLLGEFTGLHVQPEFMPVPEAAHALPAWIVLDISKAHRELAWTPSIDFQDGLRVLCNESMCQPLK